MVWFWFVLALALLVVALVLLRMDAKQRRGASAPSLTEGKDRARSSGDGPEGGVVDADAPGGSDDDDKTPHTAAPAGTAAATTGTASSADADTSAESGAELAGETAGDPGAPKLAPFQRANRAVDASAGDTGRDTATVTATGADVASAPTPAPAPKSAPSADADSDADADSSTNADNSTDTAPAKVGPTATAGGIAGAGAVAVGAAAFAGNDSDNAENAAESEAEPDTESATEPESTSETEPDTGSSPRLLDRVRALLPARKSAGRARTGTSSAAGTGAGADGAPEPVDPLAGSPIVRWLEDREFAPTQTPAPEFRHGDFAMGLSALGTVSHGVFRGRRAIMGVSGGRTVLALRRDTASDLVLDLSRPDVDSEPGFHDAGQVGALEARTSDYGRLDLIDRDRLIDATAEVPADVRRIWAEGEWVAATIDGVDDPGAWDDVVMALHAAADVLAPFPPIGGRARALPVEMDPGAPASADGPDADPTLGMDGAAGAAGAAGTVAAAATTANAPRPENGEVVVDTPAVTDTAPSTDTTTATGTPTSRPADARPEGSGTAAGPVAPTSQPPRRTGHLRLVPDRSARDLHDVPVVADRGESEPAARDQAAPDQTPRDQAAPEPDPFAEIMEPAAPVASRGDVAADHLAPRPPLSRPTRGVGQSFPEDASVPPLAAGVSTGAAGIKPLGSEDDQDEIRDEVERFDAARIDGRSDLDRGAAVADPDTDAAPTGDDPAPTGEAPAATGRHGVDDLDPSEVTQRLSVAELAERMGIDPSEMRSSGRRRRRAEPEDEQPEDEQAEGDPTPGRERPGIEPDVEKTTRIVLPPDIKD
ncbi:hypothetical protein [Dietzia sp. NCCP-2495]|uniref:hypothetical protein n=1 Tax=Dietzia sp. NCCP-2495 TaxID=2934675 RepID=UPI00222E2DED|nr:hypothetical protein [Dietzia sp. NCCP-2495]